jgi:hypothetical protein
MPRLIATYPWMKEAFHRLIYFPDIEETFQLTGFIIL